MPAQDTYRSYDRGLNAPAADAFAIAPDNANDLAVAARAIYVGGAGSLEIVTLAGNTVVFDDSGSYVLHKASGEWIPLVERGGVYTLKMWIPKNQTESPF